MRVFSRAAPIWFIPYLKSMSDLISTSVSASRQRREFWLFLLIALVVIGAGSGWRDPWPADEPRFTLVAKHMVESSDWLITHRGSELYSDKPPMFMAMQAAAYTLTRVWRIAFLLPSLLAALFSVSAPFPGPVAARRGARAGPGRCVRAWCGQLRARLPV